MPCPYDAGGWDAGVPCPYDAGGWAQACHVIQSGQRARRAVPLRWGRLGGGVPCPYDAGGWGARGAVPIQSGQRARRATMGALVGARHAVPSDVCHFEQA